MTAELRRGILLAGVGLVSGIVLIGVVTSGTRLLSRGPPPAPSQTVAPKPTAPEPAPAVPQVAALPPNPAMPAEGTRAPSFDVIRVEPGGDSVVAGRAAPGTEVELLRNGEVFARTKTDASGQFVLLPPPLPPGSQEISLRSVAPDGTRMAGPESAVVAVSAERTGRPLVAVTAPGRPTAVLSQPDAVEPSTAPRSPKAAPAVAAQTPAPPGTTPIRIASVDAEAGGKLFVSAQGAPQASVRLYLNDTLIAPGQAGPDGRIAFAIGRGVRPGDYRVRIDQVDPATGAVKTRSEVKFAVPATLDAPSATAAVRPAPGEAQKPPRPTASAKTPAEPPVLREASAAPAAPPSTPTVDGTIAPSATKPVPPAVAARTPDPAQDPGTVFVSAVSTATVVRGDNLWSISRRAYGRGVRYTVIFGANQTQIRNPNRIYPGQVFVLPGETPPAPGTHKRG
ncbi:LysM peptidoglycan-binding domain-containing protein [Methylobacterium nodulans]|uniref:Peptidoglycan-binding LysM n=1 Tax=Methylobacterium nodulans (strain LMG 21967 / CNCM I-2342 / ORS 2060) TaxID=460265 RepID=B8IPX6_METNO|nr:LysM peptidoglycan-binding domain-containing protein [Methylobacterium nodulans]ACL56626.1 Peptidoglycan-binding LysM [Methylobacterium nodulans ORS 2060]